MDSIPLKMPQGAPQTVSEDVDVTLPDYLRILQETEVRPCVFVFPCCAYGGIPT